ncbi:MAG: TIGR04283 family arsenosugar biosynthesis glycosyltransferase [Deltaproteobacteria bacterium]|nr:TIGR04283 family arsenosugar biosynthesis glycosyltransferase [Deltaproteobacteria bacterium]
MNRKTPPQQNRIIIFSRYPVPGEVKTRLIPALGPVGAADLHCQLTEKTVATALAYAAEHHAGVEMHFQGGSKALMRRWLDPAISYIGQHDGDLGQRMRIALEHAFRQGARRVLLVGTDIPEMDADHFSQAFNHLDEKDLVLGPSMDGGYWLIGATRPVDVFENITWGVDTVLEETMARADERGLKSGLLEPLVDIDTPEDLKAWQPDIVKKRPYISVIIPALNESAHIEKTIRAALNGEAEIIVVDGGSDDRTASLAARAGARVISSPKGRARQQNHGAENAAGPILLFLHADTILPQNYLKQVFEMMLDREIVLGAFSFKTDLDNRFMKGIEFLTNFRSRRLHLPYGDQALFVKKSAFEDAGGFPEAPLAEDYYFVRRLAGRGRVGIVPAFVVTSARRWQTRGLLRTMLINQIMALGFILRVPPDKLAAVHGFLHKKNNGR